MWLGGQRRIPKWRNKGPDRCGMFLDKQGDCPQDVPNMTELRADSLARRGYHQNSLNMTDTVLSRLARE